MKLYKRWMLSAATALALVPIVATQAVAQEKISMIAIDGYPKKAMWVQQFSEFFIPRVNEELAKTGNYKIEWQEAYGGSIVKPRGVLEGIKLGLGDIGIVTTIFHNSALPSQGISAVTQFPQMSAELAAENQVYLATGVVLDTYQLFSKTPIANLKDLEGKKVAGAGYNLRYLEGIEGAAGVRGGLPKFYNMVQTGLTDAAMLWPEAAKTFKIAEVAPYMLKADLGAVNSKTVTINADVWKKLPAEVQNVLKAVAVEYRDHIAAMAMDRAEASLEAYKDGGGTVVQMSDVERAAWANSMPNIALDWAKSLDEKGAPGSEMLIAYMDKLKAAGMTPIRDWAAEMPK